MERDEKGRFIAGKCVNPKDQFKKGHIPWNKNKSYSNEKLKGRVSPTKGMKCTWKEKISKANTGNKWSEESRIKFSSTQQGIKIEDWNGFKSDLNHRLRTSAQYQIWRNAVFLRDNFTCQNSECNFCNNKIGVFIQAHHKKSIAKFPELIFDIDNGITYCEEFHLKGSLHEGIAKKQLNFTGGYK